jgi:ribonuclease P protein component
MPRPPLRLKRRAQFLRAASAGRRFSSSGLGLQARVRGDAGPVQVGYTVTRKVGNSVVRNRTRRRLREAARLVLAERPASGLDLVLIGRPETRRMPFAQLIAELGRALDRIGVPQGISGGVPGSSA